MELSMTNTVAATTDATLPPAQITVVKSPEYIQLFEAYIADSDAFLMRRGFSEAVGKFTHFRLHNGNLEVHVEGMGSGGCEAVPSDEKTVAELASRHDEIEALRRAMGKDIERQANKLRSQFEADLQFAKDVAYSHL